MVGVNGDLVLTPDRFDDIFHFTLLGFSILTLVVVVLLLLRPSEQLVTLSAEDEQQLRELLAKRGARDSLGYFALRRDKSVLWSAIGQGGDHLPGRQRASRWPVGRPDR